MVNVTSTNLLIRTQHNNGICFMVSAETEFLLQSLEINMTLSNAVSFGGRVDIMMVATKVKGGLSATQDAVSLSLLSSHSTLIFPAL